MHLLQLTREKEERALALRRWDAGGAATSATATWEQNLVETLKLI